MILLEEALDGPTAPSMAQWLYMYCLKGRSGLAGRQWHAPYLGLGTGQRFRFPVAHSVETI